jgi:hypothetical protein
VESWGAFVGGAIREHFPAFAREYNEELEKLEDVEFLKSENKALLGQTESLLIQMMDFQKMLVRGPVVTWR